MFSWKNMFLHLKKTLDILCTALHLKNFPYDFTIRFYDPSLFCIFRAVLKMRF
jgi:hypothetical protein